MRGLTIDQKEEIHRRAMLPEYQRLKKVYVHRNKYKYISVPNITKLAEDTGHSWNTITNILSPKKRKRYNKQRRIMQSHGSAGLEDTLEQ